MNWWGLTKLHDLYTKQTTPVTAQFVKDDTIRYLLKTDELIIDGKNIVVNEYNKESFINYYKIHHLQNFNKYDYLLSKHHLKKPQSRYEESELKILVALDEEMEAGTIADLRQQIIDKEESINGVSRMFFFNDEKYLSDRKDVIIALKKVLNINFLANDKAQQWIYKLTHPHRKLVVLCENLDFLRRPTQPLKNNIELWYAGGRNTPKLEREKQLIDVPIYYICDWDHDGLEIYLQVKQILPTIQLLTPTASPIKLSDTPNHASYWEENDEQVFSSLPEFILSNYHKHIVKDLIQNNKWIREEDNDLIKMLKTNSAL